MADLSQLMQMSPGVGGYFAGQNQALDTQTNLLKQQQLAQIISDAQAAAEQSRQMNPLLVDQQRLVNQTKGAELPGVVADAESKGLKTARERATQQSSIDSTNATNLDVPNKLKHEQFGRAQADLLAAGAGLDSVPVLARRATLEQTLKTAGIDTSRPEIQAVLNTPGEHMPKAVSLLAQHLGDQKLAMDPQARATIHHADVSAAASRYHSDKMAGATVQAAQIRADSKHADDLAIEDIQDLEKRLASGKLKKDEAMLVANLRASRAQSDEERNKWLEFAKRAELYSYNKASAGGMGKPGLNAQGGITPRTINPVMGNDGPALGTAENPIVLKP